MSLIFKIFPRKGYNYISDIMEQRKILVDVFAILFGIGAWIAINGLWVELPLLVQELPEYWNLPSYLSIVIQIANIGPITYSVLRIFKPTIKPHPIIYIILCVGTSATLLLALFWDKTTYIGGVEHSTALLILLFFISLVDCTSSVLYIPYMAVWKDIYLPSYLIGEGLSGLLPALVALGQGVGGNAECINVTISSNTSGDTYILQQKELEPNFSIDIFFYFLFAMMVISALAFILLECWPSIQTERSLENDSKSSLTLNTLQNPDSQLTEKFFESSMSTKTFAFLLVVQAWSSMLSNGFMPSIQSYSCGPYGNVAYHLAATLSALANPLAALCTMILPRSRPKIVGFLSIIGTVFGGYIFATAIMSPSPPLAGYSSGSFLIVLTWILFVGVITYVRVEIANLMREDGASPLFWSGVVTQAGSAVGAITSFLLVNKVDLFETYNPCG